MSLKHDLLVCPLFFAQLVFRHLLIILFGAFSMQFIKTYLKASLLALTSGTSIANANLIENGSFED